MKLSRTRFALGLTILILAAAAMPQRALAGQTYVLTPERVIRMLQESPGKFVVLVGGTDAASSKGSLFIAYDEDKEQNRIVRTEAYWRNDKSVKYPHLVIRFDYVRGDAIVKLYILPSQNSSFYALVETKIFEKDALPHNQFIPIFDKDSLFGQWYFGWWRKAADQEPNSLFPIPVIIFRP